MVNGDAVRHAVDRPEVELDALWGGHEAHVDSGAGGAGGDGETGSGDGETGSGDGETGSGDGETGSGDGETGSGDGETGSGEAQRFRPVLSMAMVLCSLPQVRETRAAVAHAIT